MNEYKYSIASRMDIFYKCEQSFMLEQCSLTYNIHPSKRDMLLTPTRPPEIRMKNWSAKVIPVLTPNLCYKAMLKVQRKS